MDIELLSLADPNEMGNPTFTFAVLPNIIGFKYTFGAKYPGPEENEEFIFYRYKYIVDSIHCHITVDSENKYWIQNARETALVYVNGELLNGEPVPLEIGDVFSFGFPHPFEYGLENFPVFLVAGREYKSGLGDTIAGENENDQVDDQGDSSFFLEYNYLIFSKILSNLSYKDLKLCRLVSRKWNDEVSSVMEERGKIRFNWGSEYMIPVSSSRVFRYLNEVEQLKPRHLSIEVAETISPHFLPVVSKREQEEFGFQHPLRTSIGEPGEKLLNDLDLLLKSDHNFTNLSLKTGVIKHESDFYILNTLLQELGENLIKFSLNGSMRKLPLSMPNFLFKSLKQFEHFVSKISMNSGRSICAKKEGEEPNAYHRWVSHITPLIHRNIESFASENFLTRLYLKHFLNLGCPKLKKVLLKMVDFNALRYLSRFEIPLSQIILLDSTKIRQEWHTNVMQKIIEKFANTLECFKIVLCSDSEVLFHFPVFPKMRILSVKYDKMVRIRWGNERSYLRYSTYLPVLSKLEIVPYLDFTIGEEDYEQLDSPKEMESDETVFNAFFPSKSDEKFLPLIHLEIHTLESNATIQQRIEYQRVVSMLSNQFPNVRNEEFKNIREQVCNMRNSEEFKL